MPKFLKNPVVLTFMSGLIAGYTILHSVFILAWVCFVPLFVALHQKTLKQSVMLGMVFGFASYLNCLWIVTLTSTFTGSGIVIGLMVMLVCTLVTVLYRVLMMLGLFFISSFKSKNLIVNALNFASAWVLMEMVWNLPLSGLPWLHYYTGDTLLGSYFAIQPAAFFGVYILTFAVIFSNYLFASVLLQKNWRKLYIPVVFILFYLLAGWVSVQLFDNKLSPSKKSFTIAVLADNIPPETKWDDRSGNIIVADILDLNRKASTLKPNVILWSESAIPWTFRTDDDLLNEIHKITAPNQITHLLGMNTDCSGKMVYNSLYCILPNGSVSGRYDKSTSLDFIEGKIAGLLVPFFSDNGFYVKTGHDPIPLETPYGKAGVMICNESFLSESAGNMVKKGAEFLVCPSNDGWFRESPIVGMHFYNARLRAVETRKDIVVNSNNGFCGMIDASGKIILKRMDHVPFVEMTSVTPNTVSSFYTLYPYFFIYLCIAYLACSFGFQLYTVRKK